jgi:hypothetical protein
MGPQWLVARRCVGLNTPISETRPSFVNREGGWIARSALHTTGICAAVRVSRAAVRRYGGARAVIPGHPGVTLGAGVGRTPAGRGRTASRSLQPRPPPWSLPQSFVLRMPSRPQRSNPVTKHPFKHLLAACALLALSACEDPAGGGPRPLARVVIVAGDPQTAPAGTELPQPLTVRAEDAGGRPVQGQVLTFVVTAGGGSVPAATVQTDAEGMAANRWTLGTGLGEQRLEVRTTDPATGQPRTFAEFRATAAAGAPAQIELFKGNGQSAMVGTRLADSLAVIVRDAHGNPVPGVDVTWITPNGGTVSPNPSRTTAQGVASTSWLLPTTAAPLSIQAHAGAVSVGMFVQATPGPTASLTVVPNPITGAAGTRVQVEAVPRDAYGNLTHAPVEFSIRNTQIADVYYHQTDRSFVMNLHRAGETILVAYARGTTVGAEVPVRVSTTGAVAGRFSRISAGAGTSCGVTETGAAYCWGETAGSTPADAGFPGPVLDVDVYDMRCGLSQFPRAVRCSAYAEVAMGNWAIIDVGGHNVCALTTEGAAACWGANETGQLGNGSTVSSSTPVPVAGGRSYFDIATSRGHACAVAIDQTAWCWGGVGALGNTPGGAVWCDGRPCSPVPIPVKGGIRFRSVVVSVTHSCGLDTAGAAWCWGGNADGELGDGTTSAGWDVPVRVAGGLTFTVLSAGAAYTCGVTTTGAAYCWGDNEYGQLGIGTISRSVPLPTAVLGGLAFSDIDAGRDHTCGVTRDGRGYCWGLNTSGQLGIGPSPVRASTPQEVRLPG